MKMPVLLSAALACCFALTSSFSTADDTAGLTVSDVATETSTKATCDACPSAAKLASTTASDGEEAACASEGACAIKTAMSKLPTLAYRVGEETTTCSATAAKLAEKASEPMQFVVGKETFADKGEAYGMLISKTEAMLDEFSTPKTCSKSGMTTIAGEQCDCPITAAKKAEKIQKAIDSVLISYQVGEETCNCPTQAAALAKSTGEEKMFVVDGTKTTCSQTARLAKARAQYKQALLASVSDK